MENQYLSRIEEALASYLPAKDCLQKDVIEAMEYSLLAGGKRIRNRRVPSMHFSAIAVVRKNFRLFTRKGRPSKPSPTSEAAPR